MRNIGGWSRGSPATRARWLVASILWLVVAACDQADDRGVIRLPAIRGQVVSPGGGAPLGDVVVAVQWRGVAEEGEGGAGALFYAADETTDPLGRFEFPARDASFPEVQQAGIDEVFASVTVFRPNFEYRVVRGEAISLHGDTGEPYALAEEPIELGRFYGAPGAPEEEFQAQYSEALRGLGEQWRWVYEGEGCAWQALPDLIAALHRQSRRFTVRGTESNLQTVSALIPGEGRRDPCEARRWFRTYLAHQDLSSAAVRGGIRATGKPGTASVGVVLRPARRRGGDLDDRDTDGSKSSRLHPPDADGP